MAWEIGTGCYALVLVPTLELQNGLALLADRETNARPRSDRQCLTGQALLPKPSRVYGMGVSEGPVRA